MTLYQTKTKDRAVNVKSMHWVLPFQFSPKHRCLKSNTARITVAQKTEGMFELVVNDFAVSCYGLKFHKTPIRIRSHPL